LGNYKKDIKPKALGSKIPRLSNRKGGEKMLRLLAILLPPVAVFLVGRPIQALLNLLLCMLFVIPGIIHAWGVVSDSKHDRRIKKQTNILLKEQRERESRELQRKISEVKNTNI
jgi:uncharacterized membrane protein YqaE (UPF0057 family)